MIEQIKQFYSDNITELQQLFNIDVENDHHNNMYVISKLDDFLFQYGNFFFADVNDINIFDYSSDSFYNNNNNDEICSKIPDVYKMVYHPFELFQPTQLSSNSNYQYKRAYPQHYNIVFNNINDDYIKQNCDLRVEVNLFTMLILSLANSLNINNQKSNLRFKPEDENVKVSLTIND